MSEYAAVYFRSEPCHNPNALVFHTREELCDGGMDTFYRGTEHQSALSELLFEIRGLKTLTISTYEIEIVKADLYTWSELEPQINEKLSIFRSLDGAQ